MSVYGARVSKAELAALGAPQPEWGDEQRQPPNAYELRARELKAGRLVAAVLRKLVKVAQELTMDDWRNLAREIGVNEPSEQTVARAMQVLRQKAGMEL